MNTSVGNPDNQAPTTPGLTRGDRRPELRVAHLERLDRQRRRRAATTFTARPLPGSRRARRTGSLSRPATSYSDTNLSPATYYYRVTAEDAAGNISTASNEASAVVTGDTQAPSTPSNLNGDRIAQLRRAQLARLDGQRRRRRATTCTEGRLPDSRRARPTGSHSPPGRRTTTPGSRPAPTTTASPPRTPPATSAPLSNEASAVVTGDTQAPTTPANLAGTGSFSSVALTWSASTDNVAVTRYNLHRSTTAGFTPSAANRIAQPTGTSYTDPGLAPGTYYYRVTAEDAAGNISTASNEASAVVTGDVTAPSAPGGLTATGSSSSVALGWTASTDNVGVTRYNVHRSTTSGFTPSAANRIAQPTGTSYTDPASPPARTTTGHRRGRSRQHQRTVCSGDRDRLHGATRRPRRRVRDGRGRRHDDRRQGGYEHRHDLRRHVDSGRQVRLGAVVQRDEQHRQHPGRA